jgi:nucleotide-binding universal stress UspA family protein
LPLKDIIVHLDRGPGCTARFMAAINLARMHKACLKGLYAISHPYYAPQSALEGDYAEVRSFFINAASKSGVMAEWLYVDWNVIGVPLSEMITFHAYATDLLIIGQPHDGRRVQRGDHEPVEHLILGTGRPVVVFPSDGNTYQFGTKVLVAWRGGRESARAFHDALPLLEKASQVYIVAVVSGEAEREREYASLSALKEHLGRHAIEASITIVDRERRAVADVLLEQVRDAGADLLVMGGFTYGLRGAPVFGELSREMLNRMTVPILFSH